MSKRQIAVVLGLVALLAASAAFAQSVQLNLPRDSQRASVSQRIGITDITVNYHRPLVKGRTIWGKVAPYGQVWRAGANENTTITFTDAVSVEGHPLEKGTYGLHMIPNQDQWTVIFSKANTAWGSFSYKESEDALRVNVKPQSTELQEALAYESSLQRTPPWSPCVGRKWRFLSRLPSTSMTSWWLACTSRCAV